MQDQKRLGSDRIIRRCEVARDLGISLPTLWRLERSGKIKSIRISPRSSGFRESEISRFISECEKEGRAS
jgi:predicted DNA-binding transcriptional regulator AlpA